MVCFSLKTSYASGTFFTALSPRASDSASHSLLYPFPSNMMSRASVMKRLTTAMTAEDLTSPASSRASTYALNSLRLSATIELTTHTAVATFCDEPTARNSNLLPVKANGDVLFLSVLSGNISGIELTIFIDSCEEETDSLTSFMFIIAWKTPYRVEPEKTDITAGGASFPPRRYELLNVATDAMSR